MVALRLILIFVDQICLHRLHSLCQDGKWVKTVLTEDVKDIAGPDRVSGDDLVDLCSFVLRHVRYEV